VLSWETGRQARGHSRVAESIFEIPVYAGIRAKGENRGVRPRCEELGMDGWAVVEFSIFGFGFSIGMKV
jgi:hypothetical protein